MDDNNALQEEKQSFENQLAIVCLAFAVICFFTALYFDMSKETSSSYINLSGETVLGPLNITKPNTVAEVKVIDPNLYDGKSLDVDVDVLDSEKEDIFGFSDEFWKESGYDDEGSWTEEKGDFKMDITFAQKGLYYLRFIPEETFSAPQSLKVQIKIKNGSSLAFLILGIVSLAVCCLIFFFKYKIYEYFMGADD